MYLQVANERRAQLQNELSTIQQTNIELEDKLKVGCDTAINEFLYLFKKGIDCSMLCTFDVVHFSSLVDAICNGLNSSLTLLAFSPFFKETQASSCPVYV